MKNLFNCPTHLNLKTRLYRLPALALIVVQGFLGAATAAHAADRVIAWGDMHYDLALDASRPKDGVVAGIAAGSFHSLVLASDGSVVAWGDGRFGQTSVPEGLNRIPVAEIAAGNVHSLALMCNG